jgi:hypothetical protein
VQATESIGILNALFRSQEEYRWASEFVKHMSLRAGIGGNRGIFRPFIGPRRQDLERFGVARECGPKGVSAQVSVWSPMGMILYDTAISATPLHLTKNDTDGEVVFKTASMLKHQIFNSSPNMSRAYFRLRHQYQK